MKGKKKREEIRIIEHSEKFKSKPEQISCSSRGCFAIITPQEIGKRLAEVSKEKENLQHQGD
ncbi:MAG: hypothetical protein ACXADO_00525 [Candidatus Thorarchaeota archaeon]